MPVDKLEAFLGATKAHSVTELFLYLIIGLFILSLVLSMLGKGKTFVANTPNLLTSIGILGTFIGIVIGLIDFDPTKIDDSIAALLEGLKTAFITSLSGITGSVLFKILSAIPFFQHKDQSHSGRDIGQELLDSSKNQAIQLEAIKTAIAGEEESSLAGQIKLFRGDARDRHDEQRRSYEEFSSKLWDQMQSFAEMLSKSATEQVINALKEVIADFNNNLTEQFGENFKALDASVQKLVIWQEQYREQLTQMGEQYKQGVTAITQTEQSVAHISEESKHIPETMALLKEVMEINQHQIGELNNHLKAFKDIRDRAVEAVPEIRKQIDETVEGITESATKLIAGVTISTDQIKTAITTGAEELDANVQRLSANLTTTSDTLSVQSVKISEQLEDTVKDLNSSSRNMIETLTESGKKIESDTQAIQKQVVDSINQMQKGLEGALEEIFQAQTREIGKVFEGIDNAIKDALTQTGEGVNNQLEMIDESMQKEIERVMTEMGRALAMITGQFATDYTNLVTAMQKIVRNRGDEL